MVMRDADGMSFACGSDWPGELLTLADPAQSCEQEPFLVVASYQ
jgi:hypothetical protein